MLTRRSFFAFAAFTATAVAGGLFVAMKRPNDVALVTDPDMATYTYRDGWIVKVDG